MRGRCAEVDLYERARRPETMTIARALKLDRIGFNVGDLSAAAAFYTRALGFVATPAYDADPALAKLFGIGRYDLSVSS